MNDGTAGAAFERRNKSAEVAEIRTICGYSSGRECHFYADSPAARPIRVQTKTPDTVGRFVRMTAGSDLLSHTGFPCSALFTAPLRGAGVGFAADGTARLTAWRQVACRVQTKTPDTVGRFCSYYC